MSNSKELKFRSIKFKIFACFISMVLALVVMSIATQVIYNSNVNKYKNLLASIQQEMDSVDACIAVCDNLLLALEKPETPARTEEIDKLITELSEKKQALEDSDKASVKNNAKSFLKTNLDSFISDLKDANAAAKGYTSEDKDFSKIFYTRAKDNLELLKTNSRMLTKGSLLQYTGGMSKEIDSILRVTQVVLIVVWIVVLGIGLMLTFKIVNNITKGLNTLTDASKVMSSGDLSCNDVDIQSGDELEIMSNAFNHMKNSLKDVVKNVTVISYSVFVAARNLNKDIEEHFEVSNQVAQAIESMAKDAESQMLSVKDTSDSLDKMISLTKTMAQDGEKGNAAKLKSTEFDMNGFIQNLTTINEAIRNISGITERFAANTEELAASAEEQVDKLRNLRTTSEKLDGNSEQLEKLIQNFKISG